MTFLRFGGHRIAIVASTPRDANRGREIRAYRSDPRDIKLADGCLRIEAVNQIFGDFRCRLFLLMGRLLTGALPE